MQQDEEHDGGQEDGSDADSDIAIVGEESGTAEQVRQHLTQMPEHRSPVPQAPRQLAITSTAMQHL